MGIACSRRRTATAEPVRDISRQSFRAKLRWNLLRWIIKRILRARIQWARIGLTLQIQDIPELTKHLVRKKGVLKHR
jgi:RNase H-fold protein (predicted Holliday junction resolvase)